MIAFFIYLMSHPLWVRGLKFNCDRDSCDNAVSHPLRVRGLKYLLNIG